MGTYSESFAKHQQGCLQCRTSPSNPCRAGALLLSAAATAKIIKKIVIVEKKPG